VGRQRQLSFMGEQTFEDLWEQFPEECREQVSEHWARLIARFYGMRCAQRAEKESNDEPIG
jgi:hypothetical protein